MDTKTLAGLMIAAVVVTLVIAFIFKPMDRGLDYYFVGGIILVVIIFVIPYFHITWGVGKKVLISVLVSTGLVGVWVLGFVIAGYKIINRLF
jgi:hypothetical protein